MDYTIKVFDIGRILARADAASTHATTSRPALSDTLEVGDCCVRTFAVHSAPVKRVAVMYDQPHEFLSCSEDGTARHFDLREPLPAPASAPALRHRHAASTRGGHIVADYQTLHAELHALDTNPFQSSIFAVGGSITSIMVHDRRMPQLGSAHDVQRNYYSNWSGDRCIVRLRRNGSPSEDDVFERISDNMVTGLRFSRDTPNQVIGSWCYDYVYLFDLNLSSAYMSATRTPLCEAGKRSRSRAVISDSQSPPTVKRVRSGSRVPEHPSPVDASSSGNIGSSDNMVSALNYRARDFTRGRSLGVRILTREEAPYLFTSDDLNESNESSESTDNIQTGSSDCQVSHTAISYDAGVSSDSFVMDCSSAVNVSHCKVCQADTGVLKTAIIRLEAVGIRASDPDLALTVTERSLVDTVFRTFVASMVANILPQALDAMTFACRQLEDEGVQPSERALRALVPLEEIANLGDKTRLRNLLMAFHTDAGLDRERVRSIFHNNRTCIHSTLFRQKWSQRFHGYSNPNVDPLSSRAASDLSNDLRDIRSDLEAAFRDNSAALRLNRYNMLARYNRVLLAWDSARLDTLLFLLALQPLVGSINDPQLNMMRAEFGDLSYRLGELRSKIGSSSEIVCEESRTLAGFCNAVGLTDDGDAGEYILKCLFHENERFFEMPKRLGVNLLCEVKIVADRFEAAYRAFAGNAFAGNSPLEYAAVATQLEQCWSSLTQTQTSDLPYAYLWHRYIPSISERRNGGCEELDNVGIDIMPAFPLNAPFSCTGFGHSIAASPTNDERVLITDNSSSRSRSRSNYSTGDNSGSDSDGDSESNIGARIRPRFYSGQINSDVLAMPPSEGDWPRDTCEYLPRRTINRTISNSSHYTTDSRSHSGLADTHSSDAGLKLAVPVVLPCRRYAGHCNFQTTKDVNYLFGQYVASGSDDGRLFVWDKETMVIVQVITGDSEIVNIVEGHPYLPIVAVSGIDSEVHIFSLAKGGPVAAHRTNFPLVRGWQLAETNLIDQSSKAAYIEMVYAQDPYQSALQYSGHFTLPPGIDSSRLVRSVPRTFPAVSESCLGDMAQIISQNEDMRLSNLAHASLTNQIMTNMLLGNLFGNAESGDDSAGSSDSGSSSGSDDSGGLGSHSGMHTASTSNSINMEGNINGNSDDYDDDDDDDEEGDGSVVLMDADMREHTDGSEFERAAESIVYQEAQQRRRRRLRWVHRHFGGTGSTSEESESRFSPELDGSTLH
ncbi:hypothetical protein LPJ66_009010 [Kickxella alabastrina]|uniref:Uncharacterized protein n=1 Tax=Kickxella alabastrina TaxID=61397 RepID=A0ACC1I6P6_9FUNG|nr:hypothetical protein LPJ66_009010 [Kickxella alabastrina]